MRVLVKPYVFPVTQCSRCWKFGHSKKFCTFKKIVCPKCTGDHESCETTTFKCPNCYMDHIALDKTCPVYIKEKKIRQLMAEFNCTYKKALMIYVSSSPSQPKHTDISVKPTTSSLPTYATAIDSEKTKSPVLCVKDASTSKKASPVEKSKSRGKKSPKNKKKSNDEELQNWDSVSMTSYINDLDSDTSIKQDNQQQKRKVYTSFESLMHKIKNVVSDNETISDKFRSVAKFVVEWAISWLVDIFKDGSLFNLILKYGSKS